MAEEHVPDMPSVHELISAALDAPAGRTREAWVCWHLIQICRHLQGYSPEYSSLNKFQPHHSCFFMVFLAPPYRGNLQYG